MIRVTVWNEFVHEREYEGIRQVYPDGIHGCIAGFLGANSDISVRCATLDMQGRVFPGKSLQIPMFLYGGDTPVTRK